MFEVGDKVSVLNENATGVVTQILADDKVMVEIDGFEYSHHSRELVSRSRATGEDYLSVAPKTKPIDVPSIDNRPMRTDHIKDKKKRVVDLHAGDIVASTKGWANYEIMQMQLDTFEKELYRAMQDGITSIVFVHGVGEGVLRDAVRDYLRNVPGVEVMDADYHKFGFGATEVILR